MLSERKIKLMTKIAIYEKKEKKDLDIASKNFKVDYVTLNMLYTAITTTIGYILIVVLWVLGHLEKLFVDVSGTDSQVLINSAVKDYVICLVIFLVISLFYYSHRYDEAFTKVRREYIDLKNLGKMTDR